MNLRGQKGSGAIDLAALRYPHEFERIFEQGGIGLLVVAPDLGILDVNQAWCTMTGYRREALLGLNVRDLTHSEDLERSADFVRSGSGVEPRQIEKRYVRADGGIFWARVRTQAVRGPAGLQHALVMAVDITAEKEKEQSLVDAMDRVRIIADHVPAYISYVDSNFRYRFVNLAYEKLYQRSRDEIIGTCVPDLLGPDTWSNARPNFERALAGEVVTFEGPFDNPLPDRRHALIQLVPQRDEDGAVRGVFILVTNITTLKESERLLREAHENSQRLAAIVEASGDAIFRSDMQGCIQFWSRGAERLYGYEAAEIAGQSVDLLVADGDARTRENIGASIARREPVLIPDAVRRHKDGRPVEVSIAVFPITGPDGAVIGSASVHRDIRELKRLQEQLRHSQRLETAGQLAGGVAHDFNNIMTVVQGYAAVIADQLPADSPLTEKFAAIERAGQRAATLTRKLLTFSRRQQIDSRVLDPNVVIQDVAGMLRRTLGENVQLDVALESRWSVREDPTQLEQIVLNLALNARHAMPRGGRLRIATADLSLPGDESVEAGVLGYSPQPPRTGEYVLLTVADEGEGMDREVLERIFDPFFTTRATEEGTGLGLSVVYGIVTQAGGAIRVETRKGLGTTFKVYLPRSRGRRDREEKQNGPGPQGRESVLVVEDNADVLALVEFILQNAGYTVHACATPAQALEKAVPGPVDLVITDVQMPGMSGPEFVERWLDRYPGTAYLFISGYTDVSSPRLRPPAGSVLQKPFRPQALLERVRKELNG